MAVNKVVYAGQPLIDLSGDTLDDAGQIGRGIIAHNRAGVSITGTNPYNVNNVGAALEDILAALAEKGVTLTGTEDIDALAALIRAIETGANLPGITAIETGTHTPTANQQSFYVYHSLGIRPNFFVVIASDFSELSTSSSARGKAFICYFTEKGNSQTYFRSVDSYISSSTYFPASLTLDGAYYTNVSSERILVQTGSSTQRFTSGVTYIWIAGVIEAMVSIA